MKRYLILFLSLLLSLCTGAWAQTYTVNGGTLTVNGQRITLTGNVTLAAAQALGTVAGGGSIPPSSPPAVVQSVFPACAAPGAPLTIALSAAPSPGHRIELYAQYPTSGDYDLFPPDNTWNTTVGGRGIGTSLRIFYAEHTVVSGDTGSYTFTNNAVAATGSNPPGGVCAAMIEVSGVVSSQIAFSYLPAGTSPALPPVTPIAAGSLALGFVNGLPNAPAPSGWQYAGPAVNVFQRTTLTADATTPISTPLNINNPYGALFETVVLAPGTFAQPPTASLAAGTFPLSTQTVALTSATPGATIHYTTDNVTVPTCASPAYSGPLALSGSTTVAATACAPGYAPSAVTYNKYIIGAGTLAGVELGPNGNLHGWVPFPGDYLHTNIASASVDPNSAASISALAGLGYPTTSADVTGGIPYQATSKLARQAWTETDPSYAPQNDQTAVPFPATLAIEGNPADCTTFGDNHAVVLDRDTGMDYEFWRFRQHCASGGLPYQANNAAVLDTSLRFPMRPYGWTSATAGGLSILEAVVNYDEAASGVITHALRFVAKAGGYTPVNGSNYAYFTNTSTHGTPQPGPSNVVYGGRYRLKSTVNISSYSPICQTILTAAQQYGMVMDDYGSYTGQITFTPDARWGNVPDLNTCMAQQWGNFELLASTTPLYYADNSAYPMGTGATITSFTSSAASIHAGQCVNLTLTMANATFGLIDLLGGVRSGVPVSTCPTSTTTYTATPRSVYLPGDTGSVNGGFASQSVTVTVN